MKNFTIQYGGISIVRAKSKKHAQQKMTRWIAEALDDAEMDSKQFEVISTLTVG